MMINLQNYEEYFVRYLDGELSQEEVNEVNLFLQYHPELKQELEAFRAVILPLENSIQFSGKENLKKGITAANREDYFIRKIEKQLSPGEENELEEFLRFNPQFSRDQKLFEATLLSADSSIVFPNKKSLKKRDGRIIPIGMRYVWMTTAAACLILLLILKGFNWNQSSNIQQVAQQNSNAVNNETKSGSESGKMNSAGENKNVLAENNSRVRVAPADSKKDRKSSQHQPAHSSGTAEQKISQPSRQNATVAFSPETLTESEMTPIADNTSQQIYYLPKAKKATYREVPPDNATRFASEATQSSPAASIASSLGGELLRLSGRGDYLPASYYADQKNKEPLAVNIGTDKFGFSTTLFKKRSEKNSSTDKNRTEL